MTTAALSLLLLAAPPKIAQPAGELHEQQFTQILGRYHQAAEAGDRPTILCLEPKFRLSKALMAEYVSADEKRRDEIRADLAVLEQSSGRCFDMRTAGAKK